MTDRLSIKIAGPAGFGIKVTGLILAKVFLRGGFFVFAYTEYPSLIRGGHNTYQVDLACQIHPERGAERRAEGSDGIKNNVQVRSASEKCDILIALDEKSIKVESKNLKKDGLVICESQIELKKLELLKKLNAKIIQVPLTDLAKKADSEVMRNTVALGALMAILDTGLDNLNSILKDEFGDRGEVAQENVKAARAGYEWVKNNPLSGKGVRSFVVPQSCGTPQDKLVITGNQACALGIIASQCQMYVAYPMTPSTEILHYLEAKQRETGMVVHQPEDEIAGIHTALGASFAGARAATGTSGGGFALMNEGLSLAGMLELPLVIFEVMRPAPATGNPTWTEQGDLLYVLNAGHGEFPKIVLAPGNPEECFILTQKAFNLADKYQVPVIILSDKFLGESSFTVARDVFDKIGKVERGKLIRNQKSEIRNQKFFMRYKIEKDGVSWRTIPGIDGGEHIANSDEHNEYGYSDDSSEVRKVMMDKRMRKLEEIRKEIPLPKVYGPKAVEMTLVCWGSQLGPCLDAMQEKQEKQEKEKGKKVNVLHFSHLWPLPKGLDIFLAKFKKLVMVENNKTGQLGKLIRQETGIEIKDRILKYDSRPIWVEEIVRIMSSNPKFEDLSKDWKFSDSSDITDSSPAKAGSE